MFNIIPDDIYQTSLLNMPEKRQSNYNNLKIDAVKAIKQIRVFFILLIYVFIFL